MFINFLALIYHYEIYRLLVKEKLTRKHSIKDIILHLSRYRKVKILTHWSGVEIPKQTREIMEKFNIPIT